MLYRYSTFDPQAIEKRIKTALRTNRTQREGLTNHLMSTPHVSWADVMPQLYALDNSLQEYAILCHMHDVADTPQTRHAHQTLVPLVERYCSELAKNQALYDQIARIDTHSLTPLEHRQLTLFKRDMRLTGAHLASDKKNSLARLSAQAVRFSMQFANNLLDATHAWSHQVNKDALRGVPDSTQAALANQHKPASYTLTIRPDIYSNLMRHAENRELRAQLHHAYHTRASAHFTCAPEYDNGSLLCKLLRARHQQAQLLGFDNYAELSLHSKMADSVEQVRHFLHDLADAARPQAKEEYRALIDFAKKHIAITDLQPWDYQYASDGLRKQQHELDEETIRHYFPLTAVLRGITTIIEHLFAITLVPYTAQTWHESVMPFVVERAGCKIGYIYMDLFARDHKQSGAWMNDIQSRSFVEDTLTLPVAFLVCNFLKTEHTLLYHNEVETLLHEFGHCLHHLLTTVNLPDISGINGVEWDAVELPSQLFECWAWHEQTLPLLSAHYQTHQPLSHSLITNLLASRHFHSALALNRQIEFALLDLELHAHTQHNQHTVATLQKNIERTISIMPHAHYEQPAHAFSHIFAGGYAAGYYSYLWADVLASNAYALFKQDMLSREAGTKYLHNFLSQGARKPAAEQFHALCGHPPDKAQFLSDRIGAATFKTAASCS